MTTYLDRIVSAHRRAAAHDERSRSSVRATVAAARSPKEPIRLVWNEGDVAGVTTISNPDGEPIGFVE